jgi:hypothetical protein
MLTEHDPAVMEELEAKAAAFDQIWALLDGPHDWSPGSDYLDWIAQILQSTVRQPLRDWSDHKQHCIDEYEGGGWAGVCICHEPPPNEEENDDDD